MITRLEGQISLYYKDVTVQSLDRQICIYFDMQERLFASRDTFRDIPGHVYTRDKLIPGYNTPQVNCIRTRELPYAFEGRKPAGRC